MRLLVAMPCLNEQENVRGVVEAVPTRLPGITSVTVLVVDDGSTDETRAVAETAGAQVVSHGQNLGVGAAFQTALRFAVDGAYDIMVNIDADGQFDPQDIRKLTQPIVDGEADFVSASRFIDPRYTPAMPWVKRWGNRRMSALISRLTGAKFHDVSCGFRAYSREAMLHLNLHGRFTYTQETFLDLSDKSLRIREVPVQVRYFEGRRSRVARSIPRYAAKTSSIIFRAYRDYQPLKFFWGIGFAAMLLGMGFGAILLVHYLTVGMFTGQIWSGFVGGFFFMSGLAFVLMGVVADMLDRLRRNQERMLYQLKRNADRDRRDHETVQGSVPTIAAPTRKEA